MKKKFIKSKIASFRKKFTFEGKLKGKAVTFAEPNGNAMLDWLKKTLDETWEEGYKEGNKGMKKLYDKQIRI